MALKRSVSVAPAVEFGMVQSVQECCVEELFCSVSVPTHSFEWSVFSFRRTRVLTWTFVSLAAQ